MTTAVRFGRCELAEPAAQVDLSGDVLSCSGEITAGSYAELAAKIAQLRGMVDNPDEDVFPVEFLDLPDLSGFYRGFSVSVTAGQAAMSVFRAAYSLSATRVADFAQPTIEIQQVCVRRTNVHGIAPSAGDMFRRRDQAGWRTQDSGQAGPIRFTDDGYELYRSAVGNGLARTASYQSEADSHYGGCSSVEVLVDGEWVAWSGRQVDNIAPSAIRLNNRTCRVSVSDTGVITHSIYDPVADAWESASFTLEIFTISSAPLASWSAPAVILNSADAARLRFQARPSSDADYNDNGAASVTLSLNTGEAHVSIDVVRTLSPTGSAILAASPAQAATTVTGGLRRTANDANGNRWVIATPVARTNDTPTGAMLASTSTWRHQFMIAQALGGSAATGFNTESALVNQYIQTVSCTSRVVSR